MYLGVNNRTDRLAGGTTGFLARAGAVVFVGGGAGTLTTTKKGG